MVQAMCAINAPAKTNEKYATVKITTAMGKLTKTLRPQGNAKRVEAVYATAVCEYVVMANSFAVQKWKATPRRVTVSITTAMVISTKTWWAVRVRPVCLVDVPAVKTSAATGNSRAKKWMEQSKKHATGSTTTAMVESMKV